MKTFTRACVATAFLLAQGVAQTHDIHGPQSQVVNYSDWVNKEGKGCCNNQDCKPIGDAEVKMAEDKGEGKQVMVYVEGEWCRVEAKHYLRKGNAPNWATAHVCVTPREMRDVYGGTTINNLPPCERLLCFQPKPLS